MTEQYADDSEFYFTGADDYIMLNQSEGKLLANKNLRFALNYAINRSEYNTLVNNDVYEPAQRLVLPNVTAADSTYGERYPYEPNLETMMQIAKVLETQVDDLLRFDELPEIDTKVE